MFSVALAVWYKLRYKRKAMMLKISMVVEKTESRRRPIPGKEMTKVVSFFHSSVRGSRQRVSFSPQNKKTAGVQ